MLNVYHDIGIYIMQNIHHQELSPTRASKQQISTALESGPTTVKVNLQSDRGHVVLPKQLPLWSLPQLSQAQVELLWRQQEWSLTSA